MDGLISARTFNLFDECKRGNTHARTSMEAGVLPVFVGNSCFAVLFDDFKNTRYVYDIQVHGEYLAPRSRGTCPRRTGREVRSAKLMNAPTNWWRAEINGCWSFCY